jgi:hypothetical protein
MAEIIPFWSFLPLLLVPEAENHRDMEIIGVVVVILLLIVLASTVASLLKDGRGHTPPERSEKDWTALDLPSISYTMRNY